MVHARVSWGIRGRAVAAAGAMVLLAAPLVAQRAQTTPVPLPFPGRPAESSPPPPAAPTQTTSNAPAATATSANGLPDLGVQVYPGADALGTFDVGHDQRVYVFGTNESFANVVIFYKNLLRNGGRQVFQAPATQQFDLGKFNEQTMALVPSVTVKDYAWTGTDGQLPPGYVVVKGTTKKVYNTIIQIVPAGVIK